MNREHFENNQSTALGIPVKEIPVYIEAALQSGGDERFLKPSQ